MLLSIRSIAAVTLVAIFAKTALADCEGVWTGIKRCTSTDYETDLSELEFFREYAKSGLTIGEVVGQNMKGVIRDIHETRRGDQPKCFKYQKLEFTQPDSRYTSWLPVVPCAYNDHSEMDQIPFKFERKHGGQVPKNDFPLKTIKNWTKQEVQRDYDLHIDTVCKVPGRTVAQIFYQLQILTIGIRTLSCEYCPQSGVSCDTPSGYSYLALPIADTDITRCLFGTSTKCF